MGKVSRSSFYLYAAYSSTCLEDRAWSFGLSLCMSQFGGLLMVSIEQLVESLVQILFSGSLGKIFDKCSRKTAIMIAVPLNNFSLLLSASFFFGCFWVSGTSWLFTTFLVLGIIFAAINRLFLNVEKFIVGRDWVVVVAKNELSDLNASMTALNQLASVISPLVVGGLVSIIGLKWSLLVFQIGCLASLASKVFFLTALYKREPALEIKKKKTEENDEDKEPLKETGCCDRVGGALSSVPEVVVTYYRERSFLAAFGMALLFMTVMGFDGLAVGYGQSIGIPEAILGGFRSFGSVMGLLGAFFYAFFEKRIGVRKTGLLGLVCQQVFIIVAVISIWLPGSPMDLKGYFGGLTPEGWWDSIKDSFNGANATSKMDTNVDWKHFKADGNSMVSIFVFLFGIAMARYGLWIADLSITHIMQVGVADYQRNTVFGVHNAICQTFSFIKDFLVIALPDPSTFGLCILISYGFVTSGFFCYVLYLIRYPESEAERRKSKSLEKPAIEIVEEAVEEMDVIEKL